MSGTELTGLAFDADGTLRAQVAAETEGQVAQLADVLRADGFTATPSTFAASQGRLAGEIRVTAP